MKEQVIRSIGLVVSSAVIGGCLVWAAHIAAPHRYGFATLTRQADYGQIGRYDRLAIIDHANGTADWSIGTGPIGATSTPTHGFVEESQVAR